MYRHVIADLKNCSPDSLIWNNGLYFRKIAHEVSKVSTVLDESYFVFDNEAYTAILLLAESHFSMHTWPENNSCCFDLFTCSEENPVDAAIKIAEILGYENPDETLFTVIQRSY